jgi:hypothetical protein
MTTINSSGYNNQPPAGLAPGEVDEVVTVPFDNTLTNSILYENDLVRISLDSGAVGLVLRYRLESGQDTSWTSFKNGYGFLTDSVTNHANGTVSDNFAPVAEGKDMFDQDTNGLPLQTFTNDVRTCEFTLVEGTDTAPATVADQNAGAQLYGKVAISAFGASAFATIILRGKRLRPRNFI